MPTPVLQPQPDPQPDPDPGPKDPTGPGTNGVPAEVESLLVSELPTTVGHLGEVRIRVPADRLGEAEALLAEQDAEAGQTAAPPAATTGGGEPL